MTIENTPQKFSRAELEEMEQKHKEKAKREWGGVTEWMEVNGTIEQQQFTALEWNLKDFLPKIKTIIGEYQTSTIKEDEEAKHLLESARVFVSNAENFLAERKRKLDEFIAGTKNPQ